MIIVGLIYDDYTPSVESQIARDLIAIRDAYPREEFEVQATSMGPQKLLQALGVAMVTEGEPSLYVVYKTTEFWPDHPNEDENTVICRDLYVSSVEPSLSQGVHPGYYVPTEQGRPIREQNPLHKVAPRGKGIIDPAILMLWGGPGPN